MGRFGCRFVEFIQPKGEKGEKIIQVMERGGERDGRERKGGDVWLVTTDKIRTKTHRKSEENKPKKEIEKELSFLHGGI